MNLPQDSNRDSITSEFESDAAATSYDQWFRAKVERSLELADNPRAARYTSDEVIQHLGITC